MQTRRQGNQETRRQRGPSSAFCLLISLYPCLLVFLIVGCESSFGTRLQGDPLLGIHASPKPPAGANPPSNAVAQPSSGPIPALPATYTAPSTAAIASGETATSENPRELRITGEAISPASPSPGGGGEERTGAVRGAAPAVNIGNPEPAAPVGVTANSATVPVSRGLGTPTPASPPIGGAAANIRTYEDAQQFLKQHGVTWQRMSQDEGEWKFACGIPNPSNPRVNKTYQTSRSFPDLLSAMQAVIAQIEQTPR
jgi:hypothetical protein